MECKMAVVATLILGMVIADTLMMATVAVMTN